MSLRGIDISSWQGDGNIDMNVILPQCDFMISKATGGTHYVNPYCDGFIEKAKENGKPWGFYHYGNEDGIYCQAFDEAMYFIQNCYNYFGHGIPILDWERDSIDASWVNTFVNIVHSETGIWPWIYGNAWRFTPEVEQNCGRWVASYPSSLLYPNLRVELPEPPEVDGLMCAWQFASDGRIAGYDGNLDFSIFYGDEDAWGRYAGYVLAEPSEPVRDDIVEKIYESKDFDIEIIHHRYY